LTGDGLSTIWDSIVEHRRTLGDAGVFEDRRRRQGLQWMWTLVDEGLRAAAREDRDVAAVIERLERDVVEGRTTPTVAAERILTAFLTEKD
jgi:LAO/AO transport system kinase